MIDRWINSRKKILNIVGTSPSRVFKAQQKLRGLNCDSERLSD